MEYILSQFSINDSMSIIGDINQVLQVVLKRNSAVIANKQYISYCSSFELKETPYHDLKKILVFKQKPKTNELIQIKNIKDTFEYISLSNSGRIIKIIPFLYNNLSVRLTSILLFSESIDLMEDEDIKRSLSALPRISVNNNHSLTQPTFYLIHSNNPVSVNEELNPLDYRLMTDYLYLSSDKLVIEKRLGEGESIIIKLHGLLAFEKSVIFTMLTSRDNSNSKSYLNPKEDIVVHGPGFIMFEAVNSVTNMKPRYIMIILLIGIVTFFMLIVFSVIFDLNNQSIIKQ